MRITSKGIIPLYTAPVFPALQSIVTLSPSRNSFVALRAPTTATIPNSLLTIAAWHVRPPRSVIIADAFFINGTQSGSVIDVTRTSPSLNVVTSLIDEITRTVP